MAKAPRVQPTNLQEHQAGTAFSLPTTSVAEAAEHGLGWDPERIEALCQAVSEAAGKLVAGRTRTTSSSVAAPTSLQSDSDPEHERQDEEEGDEEEGDEEEGDEED